MMFMESMLIILLVYVIFMLFFYKNIMDMESMSSYECGFEPNSYTRMFFSYRFFLISILFIIFDVEISLMLPVPFIMVSGLGLWIFMMFLVVLILGLMYEYMCGSLDWLEVS
uniref:NADH-ubiquinone oxidoreductase chain 3 n=1 Tax=Phintella cavaleriei TaxID=1112466 RepID=A0A8A9WG47_9ARAC|nr:NADH dehydrogenase subunit 3 [Phintella cavaleriei]QTT58091.1 NADH dehydrogenase subunit 3 [Phintella cavaleriei]